MNETKIIKSSNPIQTNKKRREQQRLFPIYSKALITRNVLLPINVIGKNIKQTIETTISQHFEGKCIVEGYVKPKSSKIISYSSGLIERGTNISFEVIFECDICFPVEGTLISCVAKNITKAGIRAEIPNEIPSPIVVFVARDHNYYNNYFSSIQEGDTITVRVIGQRFELNDKYVSIIAEVIKLSNMNVTDKKNVVEKPRIIIEEEDEK